MKHVYGARPRRRRVHGAGLGADVVEGVALTVEAAAALVAALIPFVVARVVVGVAQIKGLAA